MLPAGVPVAVATVVGPLACWLPVVGAGAAVGVGVGPGEATSARLHPRAHHQLAPGVSTGSDAPLIVADGCCGYQRKKGSLRRSLDGDFKLLQQRRGSRDLATGICSHLSYHRPRGAWALEPGDEGGSGDDQR